MTIYLGSRYENSVVDFVSFTPSTDAAPIVFYEFTDIGRIEYNTYTWKEGDRLDQVAMNFYSNPERWWLIAEYNPEVSDHQNIPAGTVLRMPSV
jgi:nucleoid-associated protein YgaU